MVLIKNRFNVFYLSLAFRFCARPDAKNNTMTIVKEFIELFEYDFLTAILILIEVPIALFIIVIVFYFMILKPFFWALSFKYQAYNNFFIKMIKFIAGWNK